MRNFMLNHQQGNNMSQVSNNPMDLLQMQQMQQFQQMQMMFEEMNKQKKQ
jgi:hypothetical protein